MTPSAYKYVLLGLYSFSLIGITISCSNDSEQTCTSCTSDLTNTFEVCSDGDGNAVVNGESTGVSFDVYVSDLEATGATCGGGF